MVFGKIVVPISVGYGCLGQASDVIFNLKVFALINFITTIRLLETESTRYWESLKTKKIRLLHLTTNRRVD